MTIVSDMHDRDTRLSRSNYVIHNPPHDSTALKRSYMYNVSVVCNNFPGELKVVCSLSILKKDI